MKNFFYVSLYALAFGCSSPSSDSIDLNKRNNISITDFVDHIDVVQLESNSQSLINNITQIISYEDCYYIFDAKQQVIFCFDLTGAFRYKIHSVGRGPDEYTYLEHFNIDPFNNRLMLLEPFGSILYFDLNGKFIKKINLPSECKSYNEVYAINKDTLLFASLDEFNFTYYSSTDNSIVKRIFPVDQNVLPPQPIGRIYQYQDSIYFNSILNENEIYNLSANTLSINYKWNFGKLNYTKKQIKTLYSDYIKEQRANMMPLNFVKLVRDGEFIDYFISNAWETNRYRAASVLVNTGIVLVIYDKNNENYYVIDKTTEGIQPHFISITSESFILWDYGSYDYKYYDLNLLNDRQADIINSHNIERDNPFLVVYHLKQ